MTQHRSPLTAVLLGRGGGNSGWEGIPIRFVLRFTAAPAGSAARRCIHVTVSYK